jgi:hypothetical protein
MDYTGENENADIPNSSFSRDKHFPNLAVKQTSTALIFCE